MPIDATLDDIGRRVIYRPYVGATAEVGVITSISPSYVFVRYGFEVHSKATNSADLEWEDASH